MLLGNHLTLCKHGLTDFLVAVHIAIMGCIGASVAPAVYIHYEIAIEEEPYPVVDQLRLSGAPCLMDA